jgi:hypothetical protein
MKIIVSVSELSTETQIIIDNMRRSNAPVMIGDPNRPMAVLISLEEYQRLLRQSLATSAPQTPQPITATPVPAVAPEEQAPAPLAVPAESAPAVMPVVAATTEPMLAPAPVELKEAAPANPPAAEAIPAAQHSDIARRAAAAIQTDRSAAPEPAMVSQRSTTMQADPTLAARAAIPKNPRLTRPLPKPPRPLQPPRPSRPRFSVSSIPGGWQTIALVVGVLALGIVGFTLIVKAFGG